MNSDEVWDLVSRELGNERNDKCGWNFSSRLLNPPEQREYKETDGSTSTYWTILVESEDGYHIVYGEDGSEFGLATSGIVVCWYGGLMATIDGM